MTYWIVSGLHDNKFKANLQRSVKNISKNYDVKVVVVEQNNCLCDIKGAITLKSKPGYQEYLDVAFSFVKENAASNDWFVKVDSDDYYGPRYLDQIDIVKKSGQKCTGIPNFYMNSEDNTLYYMESYDQHIAFGGSLAGEIGVMANFKVKESISDDVDWCLDMHKAGHGIVPRKPNGWALMRYENHKHVLNMPAKKIICTAPYHVYEQGQWSAKKVNANPDLSNPFEIDPAEALRIAFS